MSVSNRRVLVIDDNLSIHDDFRKILSPVTKAQPSLDGMRSALFGGAPPAQDKAIVPFEVDSADQGQAGLVKVMEAKQSARPYAVAFVDMRMPPGWDGLETIENLWYQDPELQVVICSAYSDHPWDEIVKRVGQHDKLLVLQKPFNAIEVWQIAAALSRKWELAAVIAQQMDSMSQLVMKRTAELSAAREELQKLKSHPQRGNETALVHKETLESARVQAEYLAVLGHEIIDPLNGITVATAQLKNTYMTPIQRDMLVTVQRCVDNLRTMVDELVRLSPIESPPQSGDAVPQSRPRAA